MEATGLWLCCPLVLSKQLVVLRMQSQHQLLGCLWLQLGRQCCHPVESRTEGRLQGHRGPGGVWAGPAVVLGCLPRWPAGDYLTWLWAKATQSCPGQLWDFKSQFTLSIYTGPCACNSWVGTVPMM